MIFGTCDIFWLLILRDQKYTLMSCWMVWYSCSGWNSSWYSWYLREFLFSILVGPTFHPHPLRSCEINIAISNESALVISKYQYLLLVFFWCIYPVNNCISHRDNIPILPCDLFNWPQSHKLEPSLYISAWSYSYRTFGKSLIYIERSFFLLYLKVMSNM